MKHLMQLLPHLSIILAGLLLTIFVVDHFNGSMGFLDSVTAKTLIVLVSVACIVNACILILGRRSEER
jgi:hypothetical protein